jgi:hypothetical protein
MEGMTDAVMSSAIGTAPICFRWLGAAPCSRHHLSPNNPDTACHPLRMSTEQGRPESGMAGVLWPAGTAHSGNLR